jgi:hypothetical protein
VIDLTKNFNLMNTLFSKAFLSPSTIADDNLIKCVNGFMNTSSLSATLFVLFVGLTLLLLSFAYIAYVDIRLVLDVFVT